MVKGIKAECRPFFYFPEHLIPNIIYIWYNMRMEGKKTVAILGAGFAGVRPALACSDILPENVRIIMVDKRDVHTLAPDFHTFSRITGHQDLPNAYAVPLKNIFPSGRVELWQNAVSSIHPDTRLIIMAEGKQLHYDYCIYALGSVPGFQLINGTEKAVFTFTSGEDVRMMKDYLLTLCKGKYPKAPIRIIIGGGGFTGCEAAAGISQLIAHIRNNDKKDIPRIQIILIEASHELLGSARPWVRNAAFLRLKKLGIECRFNTRIQSVNGGKVHISQGDILAYDLLILATGVEGVSLREPISGVNFDNKRKIPANPFLQMIPHKRIFVAGDCAHIYHEERGGLVSGTAHAAILQGHVAARNIMRMIKGKHLVRYHPPAPMHIIPLGGYYALFDHRYIQIEGIIGWALKRMNSLQYLNSILPFPKALFLWRTGAYGTAKAAPQVLQ